MKKFLVIFGTVAILASSSCTKFDDSEIWAKLNEYEGRIANLENLCSQMNTNLSSMKSIVDVMGTADYVTGVTPIDQGGVTIGYTMTFKNAAPVTIYNGVNGKDGNAPVIGVKQHTDGNWYWTSDGAWMTDGEGNMVRANGTDGAAGLTPSLKVEDGVWYVSTDGGTNWTSAGPASAGGGDTGVKEVTFTDPFVIITLTDGTALYLERFKGVQLWENGPYWAPFNVGASSPEEYGDYFAWGEVTPKDYYEWSAEGDYKWGVNNTSAVDRGLTKYVSKDRKKVLEPQDDPATVNWGGKWRSPAADEAKKLLDTQVCKWTWDDIRNGYEITGIQTGNSIFMPAAGCKIKDLSSAMGSYGYYWTASVYDKYPYSAYGIVMDKNGFKWNNDVRYLGRPVRAVSNY